MQRPKSVLMECNFFLSKKEGEIIRVYICRLMPKITERKSLELMRKQEHDGMEGMMILL